MLEFLSMETLTGRDKALAEFLRMDEAIRAKAGTKGKPGAPLRTVQAGTLAVFNKERVVVVIGTVEEIAGRAWVAENDRGMRSYIMPRDMEQLCELAD